MATELELIFAEAKAKAEQASNIAALWANGGDTLEIETTSGLLPSLRKFQLENVSEISNTKLDIDMTSSISLSTADFNANLYFRAVNNTTTVILTVPAIPKLFYVENSGTSPITVQRGTTTFIVAVGNVAVGYTDGTTNGLEAVLKSQEVNNLEAIVDPTVSNDITEGYTVSSRWINTTSIPIESWVCLDNTLGGAYWAKTSLTLDELGSMATQDSTNISISGGSISGITDLAIVDGGTGASTALTAFNNIKQAATLTATGVVEKATIAEAEAGTADKYPDAAGVVASITANAPTPPSQLQATWNTGTDATESRISPAKLDAKIKTLAIGEGQAWQDVTGSRTHTTIYTNSTGRSIQLAIYSATSSSARTIEASPDGVSGWIVVGATSANNPMPSQPIIPDGWRYRINGSASIYNWTELR